MAQVSKPIMYGGLATVVIAAFLVLGEDGGSSATSSSKKKKRPVASREVETFLPEDYKAAFPVLNEPMKNAFKPLVARASESTSRLVSDLDVPVADPGWIYTGMADIDGVPTALLENTRTGDGVFLKQGESWKGVRIHKIAPEELLVTLADGMTRTVKINAPSEVAPLGVPQGGFQPVMPPIRGPIGGGLAVQPDPNAPPATRRGGNANRNRPRQDEGIGVGDEN